MLLSTYFYIKYGIELANCDDIIIETKTREVISEEEYKAQQEVAAVNAVLAFMFRLCLFIQLFPL